MAAEGNFVSRHSGGIVQILLGDTYNVNTISNSAVGGRGNANRILNAGSGSLEDLRKIADWLTQLNFRTIQSDTLAKHAPGTGSWFIDSREFQDWLSKDAGVLWVTGMPGIGKTILSSVIIDHLEKQFPAEQDVTVIFAYCRYTDQFSAKDILAALVKQLLESHAAFFPHVEAFYTAHKEKATYPSGQELLVLLQEALPSLGRVCIVFDALDELSDDTKSDLLKSLAGLHASLLLTSRPLELFQELLVDAVHLKLETQNREDIKLFIANKLRETPRLGQLFKGKQSFLEEVALKIEKKSNYMFLIASLQIESLKHCTSAKKLRDAIESLPSGVSDMYYATFERIEAQAEDDIFLAKRALAWLTYALRSLTITELQDALAISLDTMTFDEEDITPEDLIASACCGLVIIDKKSQIVRLVHYTAYDFIKANVSGNFPMPSNILIVQSCLIYLSTFLCLQQIISSQKELQDFLRMKPLLDYAYHNWGSHGYILCQESGPIQAIFDFLNQCLNYPWYKDQEFDILQSIHIAAYYGILHLWPISNNAFNDYNDSTSKYGWTPLLLACRRGHTVVVEFLLSDSSVNINIQDKKGNAPLIEASKAGYKAITELLLSNPGVNVQTQDAHGNTALIKAAENGHEVIVRLLLSSGADINTKNKYGNTALILAARNGWEVIVKLLLSTAGIDFNTQNKQGNTALILAANNGHEAVVKLLLSFSGVNVNIQNKGGNSALILSSWKNHGGIVKMLLSTPGINKNAQNKGENTAFIEAAWQGHEDVVKLLLSDPGVDKNIQNNMGSTALIDAAEDGHEAVVKALLSSAGLNVNSQTVNGKTALISACWKGQESVVKLLLSNAEVDPDIQDENRDTALIFATRHEYDTIVALLLSNPRVNVNIQNIYGDTALIEAARDGHEVIVKLLVSCNMVDLNIHDKEENTALDWASRNDYDAIVNLLLSLPGLAVNHQTHGSKATFISVL